MGTSLLLGLATHLHHCLNCLLVDVVQRFVKSEDGCRR